MNSFQYFFFFLKEIKMRQQEVQQLGQELLEFCLELMTSSTTTLLRNSFYSKYKKDIPVHIPGVRAYYLLYLLKQYPFLKELYDSGDSRFFKLMECIENIIKKNRYSKEPIGDVTSAIIDFLNVLINRRHYDDTAIRRQVERLENINKKILKYRHLYSPPTLERLSEALILGFITSEQMDKIPLFSITILFSNDRFLEALRERLITMEDVFQFPRWSDAQILFESEIGLEMLRKKLITAKDVRNLPSEQYVAFIFRKKWVLEALIEKKITVKEIAKMDYLELIKFFDEYGKVKRLKKYLRYTKRKRDQDERDD
jgi:hypothetical protein